MPKMNSRVDYIEISDKNSSNETPIENKTEDGISQRYWMRLKKITAIWMSAWIFPAILLHIPVSMTSSIKILNGIPLHWFNAALLSILVGVVLIFLYALVMDKTDKMLKGGRNSGGG
ncbi:MAG: DUF4212 domain-containing protein [Candidatus Methanomethyliaceae archaeon]|nr:DUF4212 domain-containing protein [Candidatus Methanomethyliaceae archaeon]